MKTSSLLKVDRKKYSNRTVRVLEDEKRTRKAVRTVKSLFQSNIPHYNNLKKFVHEKNWSYRITNHSNNSYSISHCIPRPRPNRPFTSASNVKHRPTHAHTHMEERPALFLPLRRHLRSHGDDGTTLTWSLARPRLLFSRHFPPRMTAIVLPSSVLPTRSLATLFTPTFTC